MDEEVSFDDNEKVFVENFLGKKRETAEEDHGFDFDLPVKRRKLDTLKEPEISYKQKLKHEMTTRDWNLFREEQRIQIKGTLESIAPFRSWTESELSKDILRTLHKEGFSKPTAIQMQAIPVILAKRDLVGISFTGSGKTLAFLLPFVAKGAKEGKGLVLAPTRELAIQIQTETKRLANLKVIAVVGGRNIHEQQQELFRGWDLIAATPGRLVDAAIEAKLVDLSEANYVVLDEADRMLEMGAESFLCEILHHASKSRQTLMFSATFAPELKKLASEFLKDPVTVTVSRKDAENLKIQQAVKFAKSETDKLELYKQLLEEIEQGQVIVFANSRNSCDQLLIPTQSCGRTVSVLHAGRTQDQREQTMEAFRKKQIDILICTDVAARGVDIPDIAHVIQFELPKNREEYTHRVGRTGRAGREGKATLLVSAQDDANVLLEIRDVMREAGARIPEQLEKLAKQKLMDIAKLG